MAKPAFRDLFVVFSDRLTNNDCLIDTHSYIHTCELLLLIYSKGQQKWRTLNLLYK